MCAVGALTLHVHGSHSPLPPRGGALGDRGRDDSFSMTFHFFLVHPGGKGGGEQQHHISFQLYNWQCVHTYSKQVTVGITVLTSMSVDAFSFRACCHPEHCLCPREPSQPGTTEEACTTFRQPVASSMSTLEQTLTHPGTHLDLVAVEEVDVRPVLLAVLTQQQQHGGIARLIQYGLTVVNGREREIFQLFLKR